MKSQVEPDHYFSKSYDSKGRFISYWHQIDEIRKIAPSNVLEIGIGNSFLYDYLLKCGYNIVTLDIEFELEPNIVGDIRKLPFGENSFDLVVSFEVLEHLPFEYLKKSLSEIKNITKKYIIFSLPDFSKVYKFNVNLPIFGEINKLIPISVISKPIIPYSKVHFWEIGMKGYSLKKVTRCIKDTGLNILKTYRVPENPYHRFFILRK